MKSDWEKLKSFSFMVSLTEILHKRAICNPVVETIPNVSFTVTDRQGYNFNMQTHEKDASSNARST